MDSGLTLDQEETQYASSEYLGLNNNSTGIGGSDFLPPNNIKSRKSLGQRRDKI